MAKLVDSVPLVRMLSLHGIPTRDQLTNTNQGNFWLFRDDASHKYFHTKFGEQRNITDAYFFELPVNHSMSEWEANFLKERLDFWELNTLINLNTPGNAFITRLFYANFIPNHQNEEFGFTTHILGHMVRITPSIVAKAMKISNEGIRLNPFNPWNSSSELTDLKNWISKPGEMSTSLNHLPAVHKLLLVFINNILLGNPLHQNLEMNTVYFLRTLLEMNHKINIPSLIVAIMMRAAGDNNISLPYSNLILALVGGKIRKSERIIPSVNLFLSLRNSKWVCAEFSDKSVLWFPNDDPINDWIKSPNARINQYTEPIGYIPNTDEPKDESVFNDSDKSLSPEHSPPRPTTNQDHGEPSSTQYCINDIITQLDSFKAWSTSFSNEMKSDLSSVRTTLSEYDKTVASWNQKLDKFDSHFKNMSEFNHALQHNWETIHGSWKIPSSQPHTGWLYSESSEDDN